MGGFILKRVLLMIPILFGVTIIVFTVMSFTPGDPARLMLGQAAPKEAVEQLREEMGLNDPFVVRYVRYMGDALHGDFGTSYRTGRPVFEEIFVRFPVTLKLALTSIALVILIGIPIGILSAVKQYSFLDVISTVSAMLMASIDDDPALFSASGMAAVKWNRVVFALYHADHRPCSADRGGSAPYDAFHNA